jgi:ribosomal protein S18 acetylase RimI-like enzyme
VIDVHRATEDHADGCVAVLAALPDHFTPDTHEEVRTDLRRGTGWVVVEDGEVAGFVVAVRSFPASAELTFAAVRPEHHRSGIGRVLVDRALADLAAGGVTLVEVKTLDESAGYEPYVATRAFWEQQGFVQVDRIDPLPGWRPGNPAALYVAALRPTR